ncbi:sensor histidine kinase [Mameliella sp. CS4]|uniref:sensor histidine kinase n=1 Tax=Mameliella sp. CS4 TaxID=2862329 RepID=UPI001C5F42E2|nr:ATP-binding protein [Mameliella sp. CS4]MBW4983997.1 sensor histidine kinase [Mameliella sp. CS4]
MRDRATARAPIVGLFLAAVAGLGWIVWTTSYAEALRQVESQGRSDLRLAADRLVTGLQRYRSLAVSLADHPALTALHAGGDRDAAKAVLLRNLDQTGALNAFYADREGRVLASAQGEVPVDLAARPWFLRAVNGALGADRGISAGAARRAYFHGVPAFGPDGKVRGVLVLVADIEALEREWSGSRPSVFFTDALNQVFVTNRSELLFWQRTDTAMIGPGGDVVGVDTRMVGDHEVWHQRLSPYVPRAALHLVQPLPVIGLTGEALVDVGPARRLAWLQTAVVAVLCLFFGSLLFLATERRRALSIANARLEGRVKDRTRYLEQANTALRREVLEREEAEAALRQAQAELVEAGKLSALGQMSAGISHELNQPLMAIRQFAENGAAFLDKGKPEKARANLDRIAGLAARAARIIKNLRAFARNESEPMGKVDVVAVLNSAVEMTEARLKSDGVTLHWSPASWPAPIWVMGGEVRLGQVFVNLINNAADAMSGQQVKVIEITLVPGDRLEVRVQDSGPGIADPDKVFEPFYSTKQVGDGMGLGLSISYGLVQSFGGRIRGTNTETGALFSVELDYWRAEMAA